MYESKDILHAYLRELNKDQKVPPTFPVLGGDIDVGAHLLHPRS